MVLLKLAGWGLVGSSLVVAAAVGAGIPMQPGAAALWTSLPVFVAGVMITAFAQMAQHIRSIDRAVTAQYVLLESYREERAGLAGVEQRRLARR